VSLSPADLKDAAKRCSDSIRLHIACGMAGKWVAIRLSDGGSDGVVYDTRGDAIRHQLHETLCAYVKIPLDDMPTEEAAIFLAFNRRVYDAGYRMTDPEQPDLIAALTKEGKVSALRNPHLVRTGRRVN
jgi:hypothetical protein